MSNREREIFVLDEHRQLYRVPVSQYEIVTDQFIIYDSAKDEYLAFPTESDFEDYLVSQPATPDRYWLRDETFYRFQYQGQQTKIRPSEDVANNAEMIDPNKVTAENLELYLTVRDQVRTFDFPYLYLPSYQYLSPSSTFSTPVQLVVREEVARSFLITERATLCDHQQVCLGRIYRYQPRRSLHLISGDQSLDKNQIQALINYRIDGLFDQTKSSLQFSSSLFKQLVTEAGVSYLLVSPDYPGTLNHQGRLIMPDSSPTLSLPSIISSPINLNNYLFSEEYVSGNQNYTNKEFLHWLLTDRDKIMRIFTQRQQ